MRVPTEAHKARAAAHIELVTTKIKAHGEATPLQRKHAEKLLDVYTAQLTSCPNANTLDVLVDLLDKSKEAVQAFKGKLETLGVGRSIRIPHWALISFQRTPSALCLLRIPPTSPNPFR